MTSDEVVDLAIDPSTRELALDPNTHAPFVARGRAATMQLCWAAMRQARSEFFADLDNLDDMPLEANRDELVQGAGVFEDDAWLGSARFDGGEMGDQLRRTLLAVPGVVAVPSARVTLDAQRGVTMTARVVIGFDDEPASEETLNA